MSTSTAFDPQAYRNALGTFTTGVTIITTRSKDGSPVGITANSFNSVSLSPPLVLWSLAKTSYSLESFTNNQHWNVHILSAEQEALSSRFASRGEDKFAGIELDDGINNTPLLPSCTARLQCRTAFCYDGGDHLIFIGEVLAYDRSDLPPLVFQSGQYALAARKPREGVRLTNEPTQDSAYTEDLLGYLAGRAHYQLLYKVTQAMGPSALDELSFFLFSLLSIRERATLEELNSFLLHTGMRATEPLMEGLENKGLVAIELGETCAIYALTGQGRESALHQIALAKAVDQEISDRIGPGDAMALKLLLKRVIACSDPGLPDLWSTGSPSSR